MKKLLIKLVIFFITFMLLGNIIGYIETTNNKTTRFVIGQEVYDAIINSNKIIQRKKIILGDSVSHQVYNNLNDDGNYYILTSNQAISVAGQYLLMRNVIEKNSNITEVNLMMLPATFQNNLDQPYTYNYFVKPFYTFNNKKYLSDTIYNQLRKNDYLDLALLPLIKIIKGFPNVDYSPSNSIHNEYYTLSPISIEYLKKMREDCNSKNIRLRILPSPISDINKDQNFDVMKKQIKDNNLNDIFSDYFNKLTFFDDKKSADHVHFIKLSDDELKYYRNKIME